MANLGVSYFQKLLESSDVVLENTSLYRVSQELKAFPDLVETIRQKQYNWTGTLKSSALEDVDDKLGDSPHKWEPVEEAIKLVEDEALRVGKLRLSAQFRLLVCCSTAGFNRVIFPPDLTQSFQKVIDTFEPHQNLLKIVRSLREAVASGSESDVLEDLIRQIRIELEESQVIGSGGKKKISLMHRAAFAGLDPLIHVLMKLTGKVSNINARDSDGQTPLHYATIAGQKSAARVLLSQSNLRASEEDNLNQTALQIAVQSKRKDIEKLILAREDVQQYVDRLSADRQVYVDAVNSILVGAALIASVTFAGWLQPPLGFVNYYNYPSPYPAPPGEFDSFSAVNTFLSIRVFYVFNSLSFFSSVATVIAGAGSVLPLPDTFIKQQVAIVRKSVILTSSLLVISIIFVLGAFTSAGFASLPPSWNYNSNFVATVITGFLLCLTLLFWFLRRLYRIRPNWWRRMEAEMFPLHFRISTTVDRNIYFIS